MLSLQYAVVVEYCQWFTHLHVLYKILFVFHESWKWCVRNWRGPVQSATTGRLVARQLWQRPGKKRR